MAVAPPPSITWRATNYKKRRGYEIMPVAWLVVTFCLCCLLLLVFIGASLAVVISRKWKTEHVSNVLYWIVIVCGVAINILRRSQGVIPHGWGHSTSVSNVVEMTAENRRSLAVVIAEWRYTVTLVNSETTVVFC